MMQAFKRYLKIYEYLAINEHRILNALHESLEYGCENNNKIGLHVRSFDSPSTTRRTSGT